MSSYHERQKALERERAEYYMFSMGYPAMIVGLVKALPPSGEQISEKRRQAIKDAFSSAIDVVYPITEQS